MFGVSLRPTGCLLNSGERKHEILHELTGLMAQLKATAQASGSCFQLPLAGAEPALPFSLS